MKFFRIIHLSDIHIGDTYIDSKDIAYRIISDVENENLSDIRCVIVTGDIFEGKCGLNENIIKEAVDFFDIIYNELRNSTKIEKTDFLFVPGNHDIMRKKGTSEQWEKYRSFLQQFYGIVPEFYNPNNLSLIRIYEDSRIAFVGFNSCGLKEDTVFDTNLYKNIERIEDSQFGTCGFEKKIY